VREIRGDIQSVVRLNLLYEEIGVHMAVFLQDLHLAVFRGRKVAMSLVLCINDADIKTLITN
jgi:hypothetical protein